MVYIYEVHMSGGTKHEHIAEVKWRNPSYGATGRSSREEMVDWINKGNVAKVSDGRNEVEVRVWDAKPPYLRTVTDGKWSDNLLALPRY